MTLALRDVRRENRELMRVLQPLIWSWRGEAGKGVPLTQTSVSSATKYAVDTANSGTGGLALRAVGGANTFTVNTAGITASSLTVTNNFSVTGNMTVGGTLGVTGATTLSSTLSAGATTVTNLTATGTLTVNGNVTLGDAATDTVTTSGDLTVGDDLVVTDDATVNGDLSVQGAFDVDGASTLSTTTITGAGAGNDQALFLQHGSGDGKVTLGATDSATPNMILKNNAGTQIGRFTNEGVFLAGALTSVPGTGDSGDVVTSDLWLVDGANYRRVFANGTSFQISQNAGTGIHLTIDSSGHLTVPDFSSDADVTVSDDLTVGGDINHDGSLIGFFGSAPSSKETITGSRGGNAALADLLSALANYGMVTDSTTA